ncbi:enhancer of mRNA-decapping protein 1-like [Helianthus annuus]|uniref:enhancer of mRNA-decapping protein 1-like n=1 Tax=Helianthus annuus TaxID=4232 RepID=UPI000B8F7A65|nr:enhancer of mRNA-decapping protein 1-like [Helianthus annuus]
MPPRFWRGRGKGPATSNDHEVEPSHRHTPSITMSTSPQEPWRVYVEPGRRSVSLSSSPSYLHSFGPQSENKLVNPPPSFIPLQRSNSHHSFGDPTPAFQIRFNLANFIQEPVGVNPRGREDHFSAAYNPFELPGHNSFNYANVDPYQEVWDYNVRHPEGPYGGPWTTGYPPYVYQQQPPPQPPYQQSPQPQLIPPEHQQVVLDRLGQCEQEIQTALCAIS